MKSRRGAYFLSETGGVPNVIKRHATRRGVSGIVSVVCAAFALLLVALGLSPIVSSGSAGNQANTQMSVVNNGANFANAGSGFLCSTNMGYGMDAKSTWASGFPFQYTDPDARNRTFTIQEALGRGATFVNYHGEGDGGGSAIISKKETPKGSDMKGVKDFDAKFQKMNSKVTDLRSVGTCGTGNVFTSMADMTLGLASATTSIAQTASVAALDSGIICADPKKPTGACFNLGKIIGGTGSSTGGLLGTLTSSLYLPLIAFVAIIAGVLLVMKGVKGRLREAFLGFVWVLGSVLVGVLLMFNPYLVTKAPMVVQNTIAGCVVGAFNGDNCMDGSGGQKITYGEGDSTSERVCVSRASTGADRQLSMTTNSITCSIWKAFVLEPLSQASFGMSFSDLDTRAGAIKKSVKNAGFEPDDFCVSLGASGDDTVSSMKNSQLKLTSDRNKVCNLMAYQMYLHVNAVSNNDGAYVNSPTEIDSRWYKVVAVAAQADGTWTNWAGWPSTTAKLGASVSSVFVSGMGSFIILVTALFALVYYISSVLLIVFAPLFLLIGVDPGRGRRILFGWLEKVVSNVLKYLVSAVFLVVAIALYGGILGNSSSFGLTMLFVIIVTLALFMYRNELMNMLGRVNMGGQQLSNRMTDKMTSKAKGAVSGTGRYVGAATGGALGGAIAGGGLSGGIAGAKDAVARNLKRRGGLIGDTVRQMDRVSVDNQRDLKVDMDRADQNAANASAASSLAKSNIIEANEEIDRLDQDFKRHSGESAESLSNVNIVHAAEASALSEWVNRAQQDKMLMDRQADNNKSLTDEERQERYARSERDYETAIKLSNIQELRNSLRDLKVEVAFANETGDFAYAEKLNGEISAKTDQLNGLIPQVGNAYHKRFDGIYDKSLSALVQRHGGNLETMETDIHKVLEAKAFSEVYDKRREEAVENLESARERFESAEQARADSVISAEKMRDAFVALKPGEVFSTRDRQKLDAQVASELASRRASVTQDRAEFDAANDDSKPSDQPLQVGDFESFKMPDVQMPERTSATESYATPPKPGVDKGDRHGNTGGTDGNTGGDAGGVDRGGDGGPALPTLPGMSAPAAPVTPPTAPMESTVTPPADRSQDDVVNSMLPPVAPPTAPVKTVPTETVASAVPQPTVPVTPAPAASMPPIQGGSDRYQSERQHDAREQTRANGEESRRERIEREREAQREADSRQREADRESAREAQFAESVRLRETEQEARQRDAESRREAQRREREELRSQSRADTRSDLAADLGISAFSQSPKDLDPVVDNALNNALANMERKAKTGDVKASASADALRRARLRYDAGEIDSRGAREAVMRAVSGEREEGEAE